MTSSINPLAPWLVELAFLDDAVADGLGAMIRRLEDLFGSEFSASTTGVATAGFDGIDRRGSIDRLLLSEWMLATEIPEEFDRRLAEGEALFLRTATDEPDRATRLAVLFDTGPTAIGAPRLVQLAALVVLARRARTRGIPLTLGLLGDPERGWIDGEFPELFDAWLHGRSPLRPTSEHLEVWHDRIEREESAWWFLSGELAAVESAKQRIRSVVVREDGWSPQGVSTVSVDFAGRTIRLDLPEPDLAVAALRGRSFTRSAPKHENMTGSARWPVFHGADRRLIARGDSPEQLIVLPVPSSVGGESGRIKRHYFNGPVLAASTMSRRVVALIWRDGLVRCQVIGKPLGTTATSEATLLELRLADSDLAAMCDRAIAPLYYQAGHLLTTFGEASWRLSDSDVVAEKIAAIAPGRALDVPRVARCWGALLGVDSVTVRLAIDGSSPPPGADPPRVLLGGEQAVAFSDDGLDWTVIASVQNPTARTYIEVEPGVEVAGLLVDEHLGPVLVALSRGHQIVQLVASDSSRTLTRLSTDLVHVAVHPALPLVAAQRSDGTMLVVDSAGSLLSTFRVGAE